jgi:hypothetical protein
MTSQRPPLILTYRELEQVLAPYIVAHSWGQDTIGDLWRMGAPTPDGGEQRRVILPGQLYRWLDTVLSEQGQPLDATAGIYARLAQT